MENIDKIKDKISKLLALRDGAQELNSMEEVYNANDKIQRLLMKYNLEIQDIIDSSKSEYKRVYKSVFYQFTNTKIEGNWKIKLLNFISEHYMCFVVFNKKYNNDIKDQTCVIYGEEHNVNILISMFIKLCEAYKIIAKKEFEVYSKTFPGKYKKNSFNRSFGSGFTVGIYSNVASIKKRIFEENNKYSLMVVSNQKELKEMAKQEHFSLREKPMSKRKSKYEEVKTNGYVNGLKQDLNNNLIKQ
jgi:hypothetical protein